MRRRTGGENRENAKLRHSLGEPTHICYMGGAVLREVIRAWLWRDVQDLAGCPFQGVVKRSHKELVKLCEDCLRNDSLTVFLEPAC